MTDQAASLAERCVRVCVRAMAPGGCRDDDVMRPKTYIELNALRICPSGSIRIN
jgi:hypothetical protein